MAITSEPIYEENETCEAPPDPFNDPWKHRSAGMSCATCMWFIIKESTKLDSTIGRCRRHAPTMSGYPVVFLDDWCGDHKINEEKI